MTDLFPRIKRQRSKVRPGRLRGPEMEKLRRERFEMDDYKCVDCGADVIWERGYMNSGHLAHVRNKRMWGDTIANTRTKCGGCHVVKEHQYGPSRVKPCKAKERRA